MVIVSDWEVAYMALRQTVVVVDQDVALEDAIDATRAVDWPAFEDGALRGEAAWHGVVPG